MSVRHKRLLNTVPDFNQDPATVYASLITSVVTLQGEVVRKPLPSLHSRNFQRCA